MGKCTVVLDSRSKRYAVSVRKRGDGTYAVATRNAVVPVIHLDWMEGLAVMADRARHFPGCRYRLEATDG